MLETLRVRCLNRNLCNKEKLLKEQVKVKDIYNMKKDQESLIVSWTEMVPSACKLVKLSFHLPFKANVRSLASSELSFDRLPL